MREQRLCSKSAAELWKQLIIGFLAVLLIGLCFSIHVRAEGVPTVTKVRLINNNDIEIHWSEEVENAGWVDGSEQNFTVKVNGQVADLSHWEGHPILYYTENDSRWHPENEPAPKTSIHMTNEITDLKNLPEIKVTIKGNSIQGKTSGRYVPEQTWTVKYEPYYTQERILSCGVRVLGSEKVRPKAMDKAKELLEVILANPKVALRMGNAGCMMGLYGEGEHAYDIPEHRYGYNPDMLYVEGFGGPPLASIRDANVLRLKTGNYRTGYEDESILTHEFGHTVYNFGLTEGEQQEFLDIWKRSTDSGKWADSYAGSNKDEFFATLSAMWFNTMNESWEGNWDGTRGPINTRSELKAYDREAYDFMAKVYVSDKYLPEPWANGSVPNNFTPDEIKDLIEKDPENPPVEDPKPPVEDPKIEEYTVKIVYNNGKKDSTQTVKEEGKAVKSSNPKRKGYTFKGWYLGNKKYSFSSKVTKDITITAKWEKVKVAKASLSSVKAQKGKKILVKIKKMKDAKGYRITYAKNKKFTKSKKTIDTTSLKKTIKLKKGTYYVRVEAYKMDSAGKKVYGAKSASKKVVVK